MIGRRAFGALLLIMGVVFVVLSTRTGSSIGRVSLWLSNAPFEVSPGTRRATLTMRSGMERITRELPLEFEVDKSSLTPRGFIRIPLTGRVIVRRLQGTNVHLGLVPSWAAFLAALGTLSWFVGLPYALLQTKDLRDEHEKPVGAWYFLLSEPGGGLSLARVQLLIWFLPAVSIYAGASMPLHRFAPMDTTLAVLLGLSGATTLLSSAASPPVASQPVTPTPSVPGIREASPPPPFATALETRMPAMKAGEIQSFDARDLVTDWQGSGDISRYQYLLLSLVGATIFTIAFLRTVRIPVIPEQFLYLLAASQATYLGTKAVKAAKVSE
jgi:hypothetical protein